VLGALAPNISNGDTGRWFEPPIAVHFCSLARLSGLVPRANAEHTSCTASDAA
jgi:hypothetical protein